MNLLHVIHDFLPRHQAGSEIYANDLCRELANRHHVHVLCAEYDPTRTHGHVTWRVHHGLPVVEIVNNWRCETFADSYRSPRMTEQIGHVLDAIQPDVVHVHNLLNLSFDLPALAHARGSRVVATLHDYTLVCPSGGQRVHRAETHVCRTIDEERCARCFRESPFFAQMAMAGVASRAVATPTLARLAGQVRRTFPRLMNAAAAAARQTTTHAVTADDIRTRLTRARAVFDDIDLFVAPSPSIAREFEQLGLSASKIRVSDYGFPPSQSLASLDSSARPARPRGSPLRIGFVGTLVWHKGVHVLLEAVRGLPQASYELRIFGDPDVFPDYSASLRHLAASLPVHFMGRFDRTQMAEVYDQLDVLVVPSLWLENSPLVIHEAFMFGVPCIGSRMGGIADLISDGANGLLYEAGSPAALAAALQRLLNNATDLVRFRQNLPSIKSIADDAKAWEQRYEELVHGNR